VKAEQMKLIIKLTAVLLVISTTGCGEKGEQAKTSDPVVLKTQLEALDKAKKVEGMLQDAAQQQRKTIDDSTISEKQ
jgi:predicted small lipoprotein YifL